MAGLFFGVLLITLFISNSITLFELTYIFTNLALVVYTFSRPGTKGNKGFALLLHLMIFTFQSVFCVSVLFSENIGGALAVIYRVVGVLLVLMPFFVRNLFSDIRNRNFPSVEDIRVFTFNEIVESIDSVKRVIKKGRRTLSKENLGELINDFPRHNSFRYVNRGSLTEEYFKLAYGTLPDENVYIIISNTGSPASEIISAFTGTQYNHASLSFDRELKTIISYNGGEKLYPPGLNTETVKYFNRKKDSSVIVYSLPVNTEKKRTIIDEIKKINEQGSAYNLFGLVLKHSFKPNIMFCSQFVYKMLRIVGANYFEKEGGQIKPTDLVELDYEKKLRYE
ncbi:MAG: hypothetical protein LBL25_02510, partial [Oscillospiraceae bacterium]|nr:hypothetical protein [Oscillospiraceae bacterium]